MTHSVLEANGIHNTASPLSSQPVGAMKVAKNVVIRAKDTIEPRRGQPSRSYSFLTGAPYYRAKEVAFFPGGNDGASAPVIQVDDSRLYRDTGSAFAEYAGNFTPPEPETLRAKFADCDESLFFTTSTGLQMLESFTGTPRLAGLPKPTMVETQGTVIDNTSLNWLADDTTVAVRVLFGRRDGEKLRLGPPSERGLFANEAGGDRSIRIVAAFPEGVTTDCFYRIYMTDAFDIAEDPGDECWLVYEAQLTSTDIAAGQVTKDITGIEAVLSDVPLYTSPNNGDGIEAAKLPPPWATDICRWKGRVWAFNIKRPHSLTLTLLGLSSGGDANTGLYDFADPTITINGKRYLFDSSGVQGDVVGDKYTVANPLYGGASTTSEQIADAAKHLVLAINDNDEDLVAYYSARQDGWPGEIVIEAKDIGGDGFDVVMSTDGAITPSGESFSPSVSETVSSSNQAQSNGFACSDVDEPEAWPLFNYGTAGNRGARILRGIPLRDSIVCLMNDGTVQLITGTEAPYRVDELDSTAKLVGPDTACVLNNQVWAFTLQGVCSITEAGVAIVGLPVEADMRGLFGSALETVKACAFGFGYESERTYTLWLPARAGETWPSQGWGYNYATKTWTLTDLVRTCGRVCPLTDVLYTGNGESDTLCKERKELTPDDFCDEEFGITVSVVAADVVTVSSTDGVDEGDCIQSDGSQRATVVEVVDDTHLRLSLDWSGTGSVTVFKAFESEIEWKPADMDAPALLKEVTEFTLHFWEAHFYKSEAWMATDASFEFRRTKEMRRLGWGTGEWGDFPFGDPAGPWNARTAAPDNKSAATYFFPRFTIREAKAAWKLLGYSMNDRPVSERTKR